MKAAHAMMDQQRARCPHGREKLNQEKNYGSWGILSFVLMVEFMQEASCQQTYNQPMIIMTYIMIADAMEAQECLRPEPRTVTSSRLCSRQ